MKQAIYESTENETNDPIVEWLLKSEDPSVQHLTLTDILNVPRDSAEVEAARRRIPFGPKVRALLDGQKSDGGFGVHPYQKWTGAHWRLVSLVELGVAKGFRPAVRATDLVLDWLLGDAHVGNVPQINGLYRRCASQEGNALAVCSRLGLAKRPSRETTSRIIDRLAVARWRMELRSKRGRSPLFIQ